MILEAMPQKLILTNQLNFRKKLLALFSKKPIDYPPSEVFRCSKLLSIDQMYQLKILMSAHSLFYSPQLIPFTLTLLEALCSISLLPSLRPLLSKYALLISYHFYGTIYLLILNKFLIHLNLKHL